MCFYIGLMSVLEEHLLTPHHSRGTFFPYIIHQAILIRYQNWVSLIIQVPRMNLQVLIGLWSTIGNLGHTDTEDFLKPLKKSDLKRVPLWDLIILTNKISDKSQKTLNRQWWSSGIITQHLSKAHDDNVSYNVSCSVVYIYIYIFYRSRFVRAQTAAY